ncbi:DHHC palmitoyltransferase-domain-containing protein [Crepidotus variabilis]|uniref:Palmitoyltransferase n=1 Tax=Crepidotus variabilis TaxID=179855 RepID=A0A9P6EIR2_9AGAR|nr:DHHC palmitoyltransferase-domain-containing protein [Crepidotus variabilis]
MALSSPTNDDAKNKNKKSSSIPKAGPSEPSKAQDPSANPGDQQHSCCGTIQNATFEARERRDKRRATPQPWLVRKLLIPFTLGILGYSGYVFVSKVCLGMIRRENLGWGTNGSGWGRGAGIALLTVFGVLYSWVVWAYIKVVVTSPGYAKDHIAKSSRPQVPAGSSLNPNAVNYDSRQSYSTDGYTFEVDGEDTEIEDQDRRHRRHRSRRNQADIEAQMKGDDHGLAGPSYEDLMRRDRASERERTSISAMSASRLSKEANSPVAERQQAGYDAEKQETGPEEAGILDALPLPSMGQTHARTDSNDEEEKGRASTSSASKSKLKKPVPARLSTRTSSSGPPPTAFSPISPVSVAKSHSRSDSAHTPTHTHPNTLSTLNANGAASHAEPSAASIHPYPHPIAGHRAPKRSSSPSSPSTATSHTHVRKEGRKKRRDLSPGRMRELDQRNVHRRPPTTAVLNPVHRYCGMDEIVKPGRTHHCRSCGTCVLKYDHHCPWIGQCVGARNHKFFINFCFITAIFTAYVFATTVAYTVIANRSPGSSSASRDPLDPQQIVLIALAGLFFIFTVSLFSSHVNMILHGQTTVESMHVRTMKEKEDEVLARGFKWWEISAKRIRKRQWDEEWGSISTEGNIWWKGNKWDEWVDVMGRSWVGWIFPVGRSQGDGLNYPANPRFDEEGRWRRRVDWPQQLR